VFEALLCVLAKPCSVWGKAIFNPAFVEVSTKAIHFQFQIAPRLPLAPRQWYRFSLNKKKLFI
jgi:hypothetical protein